MSILQQLRSRCSLAATVLTLIVCTQTAGAVGDAPPRRRTAPRPRAAATATIQQSANGQHLTLPISSLEKEFLIHASLIPQTQAATSEGTLSRVVFFRRRGNQVFLMESPKGQVVTPDLPSQLILAEIPVIASTEQELVLDFNAGMKTVFTAANWYGSDFSGGLYDSANRAEGTEVTHSFIERILTNEGTTEIRQIVQLNLGNNFFPTYEVRYYITPYAPNPEFQPRENKSLRQVGYFETAPVLETTSGRQVSHISRWNVAGITKPIVYYISANTPPEYVNAIKEGILYWNKAFGGEVLKAEIAPAGVSAPTSKENIVQWVPWDNAGFAYADALSDPRTGEILHAQVYLTSVFAFSTKEQVRQLLRSLQDEEEAAETSGDDEGETADAARTGRQTVTNRAHHQHNHAGHSHQHITPALKFLGSNRLCQMDLRASMVRAMEKLLDSDLQEAAILRLSQDMIRSVVAHEIGHTLGLRHNFAGKLISNLTFENRDKIFQDYLTKGEVPGTDVVFSSSVMDYLTPMEDYLMGAQINNMEHALPYDEMAIAVGYSAGEPPAIDRQQAPLFCTDSGLATFADCDVFTSGARPIANNAWEINNAIEQMPSYIVNRFIAAKAALDHRDRQPLDEVVLRPDIYASRISRFVARQLVWLNSGARSAYVERRYPQIGPMNFLEVQTQTFKWVEQQIKEMGGVQNVFFSLLPLHPLETDDDMPTTRRNVGQTAQPQGMRFPSLPFVPQAVEKLDLKLNFLKSNGFMGSDGKHYQFTDAELTLMREQGIEFLVHVEEQLFSQLLDAFLDSKMDLEHKIFKTVDPDGTTGQVENHLAEVASSIIFAANDEVMAATLHLGPRFHPSVVVPVFAHTYEVRMKAARLLSSNIGAGPDWSLNNRRAIAGRIIAVIENYIGKDFHTIKVQDLERPLSQWFMEQHSILSVLMGEIGCEDLLSERSPKDRGEDRDDSGARPGRRGLSRRRG